MTSKPFPAGKKDPLLICAKVFAVFILVMMAIGMGALAFAFVAVLFKQGNVMAELAEQGVTLVAPQAYWAILALMGLALIPLGLIIWFIRQVIQLIDSAGSDDPFSHENAARLSRMGWLTLAIQACGVPLGALGLWLSENIKTEGADFDVDIGFSGSGLMLTLLLFILARLFRHGAAMREELEGTV